MIDLKLNKRILLVELPQDAIDIEHHQESEYNDWITYHTGMGTEDYDILRETLPSGNWSQPIKASEVTEEIWNEIVESARTFGYRDYNAMNGDYQWCARAKQSGMSLLTHHSLSPDKTILIIEK